MQSHLKKLKIALEEWGAYTASPVGVIDFSPATSLAHIASRELVASARVGIRAIKLDKDGNFASPKKYKRYISQQTGAKDSAPYKKSSIPNYWRHGYFSRVTRAVRELATTERVAIEMTFIEGKPIAEIAKVLDISESGVKQAKRRAYDIIYAALYVQRDNGPRRDK